MKKPTRKERQAQTAARPVAAPPAVIAPAISETPTVPPSSLTALGSAFVSSGVVTISGATIGGKL